MTKKNVLKSNKELQQVLSKYPDDMEIAIGVESSYKGIGFFYDVVCGGIKIEDDRFIYISSEGLGLDIDSTIENAKEGEYNE